MVVESDSYPADRGDPGHTDHETPPLWISRVAASFGPPGALSTTVLAVGHILLTDDPTRLQGARVLGVEEHCRGKLYGGHFVT